MTNLHDARVEAAARALDPIAWAQFDLMSDADQWPSRDLIVDHSLARARQALAAADAVVTVEMIADALRSIPDAEPGDRRDPATVIAEYLHSSLFGEVAGDDSLLLIGQ